MYSDSMVTVHIFNYTWRICYLIWIMTIRVMLIYLIYNTLSAVIIEYSYFRPMKNIQGVSPMTLCSITLEQYYFLILFQRGTIESHWPIFKIIVKYTECLRKLVGIEHSFFVEYPVFDHRFVKYTKNETEIFGVTCA